MVDGWMDYWSEKAVKVDIGIEFETVMQVHH